MIFTLPNSFLCLLLGGQCAAVPHSSQIIGMRQFLFSFLLLTKFITMSVHMPSKIDYNFWQWNLFRSCCCVLKLISAFHFSFELTSSQFLSRVVKSIQHKFISVSFARITHTFHVWRRRNSTSVRLSKSIKKRVKTVKPESVFFGFVGLGVRHNNYLKDSAISLLFVIIKIEIWERNFLNLAVIYEWHVVVVIIIQHSLIYLFFSFPSSEILFLTGWQSMIHSCYPQSSFIVNALFCMLV